MSFLDPVSGAWASIAGSASVISDPAVVEKYYSPTLKAWLGDMGDGVHDGSSTDPRIGVIKLEAKLATHVVSRKGILGRAVDTVKGAVQGSVPAINSIRELSLEELAECEFFFPFVPSLFSHLLSRLGLIVFLSARAPHSSGVNGYPQTYVL